MDENRAQAYTNLIQQLLSCPSEERPQILQENQELLDRDLSQVLLEETQHLLQVRRIQEAEFLINLSQQLLIPGSPHYDRDYHSFLMEVLQTVSDSQGNPQQVYPFLQQNLDKLDLQLVQILTAWANDTFAKVEAIQANNIAADIGNLGNLIRQFPLGSRLVNLEIAIACYEIVSTVYTREAFPQQWAMTQNNLGLAYNDRIRGEKAQNIESAIAFYTSALEVRTRDACPQDWAMTQNNLAIAYSDRIRGEKAQNIESAIASYTAALEVYTRDAFPQKWAMTQNNLANAYSNRITGEKAENIESAIASYTAALEVYTRQLFPKIGQ